MGLRSGEVWVSHAGSDTRREPESKHRKTYQQREREREHSRHSESSRQHRPRRRIHIEEEVTYVYKPAKERDAQRDASGARSSRGDTSKDARRSSSTRERRPSHDSERPKSDGRASTHRKERDELPLRRERRSIVDDVRTSAKDSRPSVSRSHSLREHPPPPPDRPLRSRSRTGTTREPLTSPRGPPPLSYNAAKVERVASLKVKGKMVERPSSRQSEPRQSTSSMPTSPGKIERSPSIKKERSASIPAPKLERNSSSSSAKPSERPRSLVASLFTPSPPSPAPPRPKPKQEKLIECLTCCEATPISKIHHLPCSHDLCNSCIKRLFTSSLTDPQLMPPKCCDPAHPIHPERVGKLFSQSFKKKWNRKYQEYTTADRLYCPQRHCGAWIKPNHIHPSTSPGKSGHGTCSKCRTRVCTTCSGRWHASKTCPKDPATKAFQNMAKEKGWQSCYNCTATVELEVGCNHMTCRCGAEFCMVCGSKWQTCFCPMFDDRAVERDRMLNQQGGYNPFADGGFWAEGWMDPPIPTLPNPPPQPPRANPWANELWNNHPEPNRLFEAFAPHENLIRRAQDILSAPADPRGHREADRLVQEIRGQHNVGARDAWGGVPQREARQAPPPPPPQPAVQRRQNFDHDPAAVRRPAVAQPPLARQPRLEDPAGRRASTLAGIARGQSGQGRVDEWRRHVHVRGE